MVEEMSEVLHRMEETLNVEIAEKTAYAEHIQILTEESCKFEYPKTQQMRFCILCRWLLLS